MKHVIKGPKMNQNLFTYLPQDITIDILSRLPILTVLKCKLICKLWRDLIETLDFAKSHHSKSAPSLAVSQDLQTDDLIKKHHVFEFIDDEQELNPAHRYNRSFNFKFPDPSVLIHGSACGLLFLSKQGRIPLYICNPITREYIELPPPLHSPSNIGIFGFGVGKTSGQYKLVRLLPKPEVYTLGSGCWRSIGNDHSTRIKDASSEIGAFVSGKVHWVGVDWKWINRISCFDVETELFSSYSLPILQIDSTSYHRLVTLRDRLCLYEHLDSVSNDLKIVIWSMEEYGDEKSWTRVFFFEKRDCVMGFCNDLEVVKVFKDGEVLIREEHGGGSKHMLLSTKTNSIRTIHLCGLYVSAPTFEVIYTPSFLAVLGTLMEENVRCLDCSGSSFSCPLCVVRLVS